MDKYTVKEGKIKRNGRRVRNEEIKEINFQRKLNLLIC